MRTKQPYIYIYIYTHTHIHTYTHTGDTSISDAIRGVSHHKSAQNDHSKHASTSGQTHQHTSSSTTQSDHSVSKSGTHAESGQKRGEKTSAASTENDHSHKTDRQTDMTKTKSSTSTAAHVVKPAQVNNQGGPNSVGSDHGVHSGKGGVHSDDGEGNRGRVMVSDVHKMAAMERLKARKLVFDIKRLLGDTAGIEGICVYVYVCMYACAYVCLVCM
jgi:hypothetical protein